MRPSVTALCVGPDSQKILRQILGKSGPWCAELSLFDNPVVWQKTKRGEYTQINIMSNIVEPFLNTSRLSVSFSMHAPLYRMTLEYAVRTLYQLLLQLRHRRQDHHRHFWKNAETETKKYNYRLLQFLFI